MSLVNDSSSAGGQSSLPLIMVAPMGLLVCEKLSKNYLQMWKMQVLPTIRDAQREGFLDGTAAAPMKEHTVKTGDVVTKEAKLVYAKWLAQDQ
jgi:hypothetical protein